eukprot:TRINITY_DN10248_c0_g1_i1.p2 TRINITY_DN10248_c0_g1~~TRINITY_DN10248_c0_g1_i1.p2  ORF type:complete len:104 (-),score=8.90 TRINITY_DN10248_c0_g1_i1:50-361(-)
MDKTQSEVIPLIEEQDSDVEINEGPASDFKKYETLVNPYGGEETKFQEVNVGERLFTQERILFKILNQRENHNLARKDGRSTDEGDWRLLQENQSISRLTSSS